MELKKRPFWDDILNYTSSRINTSCVSGEMPTSGYHKIFMYYSEFNYNLSCGTGQPNKCHTWVNSNRDKKYKFDVGSNCSDRMIDVDEYIGPKNCI